MRCGDKSRCRVRLPFTFLSHDTNYLATHARDSVAAFISAGPEMLRKQSSVIFYILMTRHHERAVRFADYRPKHDLAQPFHESRSPERAEVGLR